MRKLMTTSALVLPLLAVPAYAQETPPPQPEDGAEQTATTPEDTTTGEAEVTVESEEPAVEVTQEEPQVEVVQEEPQVEIIREGEEVEGEEPMAAEDPAAPRPEEEPAVMEDPAAEAPATAEEAAAPVPAPVVEEMGAEEIRGDWVIGTTVLSPQGETIGQIQDVILNPDGQISAAILSVGGFLGIGAKNIAVDWNELQIGQDGQEITLDLTREEAEQAPEYTFRDQAAPPEAQPVPATGTAPGGEPAPGMAPETAPGAMPEAAPGAMPEAEPGAMPEAEPGAMPEAEPGAMPEAEPEPTTAPQ